jgi:hypothetical protein
MNASNDPYGFEVSESPTPENSYDFQAMPEESASEEDSSGIIQPIASVVTHGLGIIPALPGNLRDLFYSAGDEAKRFRELTRDKLGMDWDFKFAENDSIKNYDDSIRAPFTFINGYIPNTEKVNKFIDESFGGYLAPKGAKTKFVNDLAQDIVSSALNRNPKDLVRNFLIPLGSNIVKKGAELFGVDPSSSEVLKMLTWMGADMASISDPRQMLSNRFNQTRRLASPGDMIQVRPRDLRFLDQLEADMLSGGTRPSTTASLTKLREMRDAMATGQVSARQMLDFYRANNELLSNFGAFSVEGASKAEHVYRLNQTQQLTRNMLDRYGRNQNPRFAQSFRENNLAWASLQQSNNVAAFVKKNYTKPFVSEAAKAVFANSGGKGLAVATGLTALERLQAFVRRLENPVLRQYYGEVLGHSLRSNVVPMVNSMQKFDNAAKKFEEKESQ